MLPNMDDVPFFNTMDEVTRGGIFDSASKDWVAEKAEENGSEDNASIKSAKSDKSAKSMKTVNTTNTVATAPTPSSSQTDGLRYRNNKTSGPASPAPDNGSDVPEMQAPVRAETSPSLVSVPTSKKPASSFRMFNSRPSSVRTDSVANTNTERPETPQSSGEASRKGSADQASTARGFDLPSGPAGSAQETASRKSSVLTTSTTAPETSDTPRSMTPNEKEDLSRQVDPSEPHPDQNLKHMPTSVIMTAVRARDKAALQNQANVAKDNIKKWGINFVNKRRTKDGEDGVGSHPHPVSSSYYAPSAEEREGRAPRTSLQERLNAAAQAKRENAASQHGANPSNPASYDGQAGPSSPTIASRGPSVDGPPASAPRLPARRVSNAEKTEPLGTSPPTSLPPPAARMVVPSVPKRAGVVTGIGHNPASASAEALDQAGVHESEGPPSGKPNMPRADSDPNRSTSAPPDAEPNHDKASTPLPEVTAASVTTRLAAGNETGSSPARQSLLAHHRNGSGSNGSVPPASNIPVGGNIEEPKV